MADYLKRIIQDNGERPVNEQQDFDPFLHVHKHLKAFTPFIYAQFPVILLLLLSKQDVCLVSCVTFESIELNAPSLSP